MKLVPLVLLVGIVAGALIAILIRGATPSLPPAQVDLEPVADDLARLADGKVFFGHQSVGDNILDGVEGLVRESPEYAGLRIVELNGDSALDVPALYHAKLGMNKAPESKFIAFEKLLIEDGLGSRIDAAMLKLCYADIVAGSNVNAIFAAYAATIARIKRAHPHLIIVHCTIPLRARHRGIRDDLRTRLIGHPDNVRRFEYNQLVRTQLGTEPLFDLAALQSTHQDGLREAFARGGSYEALCNEYASDGGHLNSDGAKRAARGFLRSFAAALKTSSAGPTTPQQ